VMTRLRVAKVAGIAKDIPPVEVDDPTGDARVLVLGWGSTYGAIQAGVRRVRAIGHSVAHAHVRHLNPFPSNLGDVVRAYERVLVPEMNLGQLVKVVRGEFLVDAQSLTKVMGQPYRAGEIERALLDLLDSLPDPSNQEQS
ncbi:MAG: 2-oxoglutarate ferredoxin oxidoreductase subunit alpha, partial [Acidimicrobiaceae bacterium]|nr:2-oxoglutarate ferredoxin oxidoreductase subunit alpha [Acidimicrobiaceae bacterium]